MCVQYVPMSTAHEEEEEEGVKFTVCDILC